MIINVYDGYRSIPYYEFILFERKLREILVSVRKMSNRIVIDKSSDGAASDAASSIYRARINM